VPRHRGFFHGLWRSMYAIDSTLPIRSSCPTRVGSCITERLGFGGPCSKKHFPGCSLLGRERRTNGSNMGPGELIRTRKGKWAEKGKHELHDASMTGLCDASGKKGADEICFSSEKEIFLIVMKKNIKRESVYCWLSVRYRSWWKQAIFQNDSERGSGFKLGSQRPGLASLSRKRKYRRC